MITKSVRFWDFVNDGFVKLTLKPGQRIRHEQRGSHDEGWWSRANAWEFDGKKVFTDFVDDGTDCDGRLTRGITLACPVEKLRDRIQKPPYAPVENGNVIGLPDWEKLRSGQRDYNAEAAGY